LSYRPNGTNWYPPCAFVRRTDTVRWRPSKSPAVHCPSTQGSRGALPQASSAHNGQGEVLHQRPSLHHNATWIRVGRDAPLLTRRRALHGRWN